MSWSCVAQTQANNLLQPAGEQYYCHLINRFHFHAWGCSLLINTTSGQMRHLSTHLSGHRERRQQLTCCRLDIFIEGTVHRKQCHLVNNASFHTERDGPWTVTVVHLFVVFRNPCIKRKVERMLTRGLRSGTSHLLSFSQMISSRSVCDCLAATQLYSLVSTKGVPSSSSHHIALVTNEQD